MKIPLESLPNEEMDTHNAYWELMKDAPQHLIPEQPYDHQTLGDFEKVSILEDLDISYSASTSNCRYNNA